MEDPPVSPPRRAVLEPPNHPSATDADESSSSGSDDGYESFESDVEDEKSPVEAAERKVDAETRALERQRVLEAAGFIIKPAKETKPRRRRRPAPQVPERRAKHEAQSSVEERELPEIPKDDTESIRHLDDAYDRYEAFRQKQFLQASNRNSIASELSVEIPPTPLSPTNTMSSTNTLQAPSATSTTTESRLGSGFLHSLLGRKTPVSEKRSLVISAPTMNVTVSGVPSREGSPSFGTSWSSLVAKEVLEGIPTEERKRQEVSSDFAIQTDLDPSIGNF